MSSLPCNWLSTLDCVYILQSVGLNSKCVDFVAPSIATYMYMCVVIAIHNGQCSIYTKQQHLFMHFLVCKCMHMCVFAG